MKELKKHSYIFEYLKINISHTGAKFWNAWYLALIKLIRPNRIILISKLNIIIHPKLLAANLKV